MSGLLNFNKNKASSENNDNNNDLPSNGTSFAIDILKLNYSRLNPRKTHGKDYEKSYQSLKQSIKNIGLQSTLTVTKKNIDDEQYELYNGGNTRLRALTELYEEYSESGEEEKANMCRYQQVIYVPYTEDLDVLIKHMAENEERIDMTFIDKARAVFQIKELYLTQSNEEDISNNKLVKYIHELGWTSVNQQSMTELTFAFEKLDRILPLSLNNGLGRPKIQQLRVWLGYVEKYIVWLVNKHSYNYSFSQAEQLYFNTLSEADDDEESINLKDFFDDYIFKLSNKLMEFDNSLKFEVVKFEFKNIAEYGYVFEERDPEELSKELRETSNVPPFDFPEPRKPRETKNNKTGTENDENKTGTGIDNTNSADDDSKDELTTATGIDVKSETVEDYAKHASQVFQEFFKSFDSKKVLRDIVLHNNTDEELHIFPPFFTLDISSKEKYNLVVQTILGGEWAEQYSILHFLSLYQLYVNFYVEPDSFEQDEKETLKYVTKLLAEFLPKYNYYTGMCKSGIINQEEFQFQKEIMTNVDGLMQRHWQYIRNAEAINNTGNNGDT